MGKKKLQGADGMNFQLQLTIKGLESINLPEENLTNESGNDIMKISCWGGKLSAYVNLPNAIRPNNVQPFQLSDCIKIELVRNQVIEHMRSYLQKHLKDKYSDEFLSMMSVTKMECNLTIKCVGDCKPKDVIRLFERSFAKVTVYKETDPNGKTHRKPERGITTTKPYYVNEYTESYTVPTQYKVFFTLSLFCGFRKGETLALHWNDIDFKEKKISISKSVGMTENGFDYKEPKTKKSVRKVSIPDDVIPLLKQYHFEYIQTRFSHGTAWQGDLSNGGNLFIQADGKLMGHTTPYQYFTKHLHRYNEWVQNNPDKAKAEGLEELPIIPLHGLRHSCATLLNYLEVNIIEISKTLGHSTCSTTMNIYAHSFEEQQEEVATKVNEFLRLNA